MTARQLSLLAPPREHPPYQRHSKTSIEAARKAITPSEHNRRRLLDALDRFGPLTDDGLEWRSGLRGNTVRPRRRELCDKGFVVVAVDQDNAPLTGLTRMGNPAVVWRLTPAGRDYIEKCQRDGWRTEYGGMTRDA